MDEADYQILICGYSLEQPKNLDSLHDIPPPPKNMLCNTLKLCPDFVQGVAFSVGATLLDVHGIINVGEQPSIRPQP